MLNRQITFALFFILAFSSAIYAGPADDLFKSGNEQYSLENYKGAIETYQKIVTEYASTPIINDVKLILGKAFLYNAQYTEAIDTLSKLTDKGIPDDIREDAYFYLGQAQLSLAGSVPAEDPSRAGKLGTAVVTFTTQLTNYPKSKYREDALFDRALASFFLEKYEDAEKDFATLASEFSSSVNRADYVFWQGRTYAARTTKAISSKAPKADQQTLAQKAKDIYAKITDADNLIVANDARFESAELDFFLAEKDQYNKVIDEYNQVRRRDDLIPDQMAKIDSIRAKIADAGRAGNKNLVDSLGLLRTREQGRLNELQTRVDPAIKSAIRKSQCYIQLAQYDESRLLLHRVQNYTKTKDDKKDIDFNILFSYALQGQVDKANSGLDQYLKDFPSDKEADIISLDIGNAFMQEAGKFQEEKNLEKASDLYQKAYDQYQRSLNDFPTGRYADEANLRKASAMVSLGKLDDAVTILSDFVTKNPKSPHLTEALYSLGTAQLQQGNYDEAIKSYTAVRDNPDAGIYAAYGQFQLALVLLKANRPDDSIAESKTFLQKFPDDKSAGWAALYIGLALDSKKDPTALQTLNDVATKYSKDENIAAAALNAIAAIYERARKIPDMIAAYDKVYTTFPKSKEATTAQRKVADYYSATDKFDDAAKLYGNLVQGDDKTAAASAAWSLGNMWYRAAQKHGFYNSCTAEEQKDILHRLDLSEKSFVTLLKQFPDSYEANRGFEGIINLALLKNKYGLLAADQINPYLNGLADSVTDATIKNRFQLAAAGIKYELGNRADAFADYKKLFKANPDLPFGPSDARRYGDLLIESKDIDGAIDLFTKVQKIADPTDKFAKADIDYGLGAASYAKQDYPTAKQHLEELVQLFGWHPKISQARLYLGHMAHLQKDYKGALTYLGAVNGSQSSSAEQKAQAMMEMGDVWFDQGKFAQLDKNKPEPNAAAYYLKVEAYFGGAMPEIGAEGLFKAGQAYEKAGQKTEAAKQYQDIVKRYSNTSFSSQAADKLKTLPPPVTTPATPTTTLITPTTEPTEKEPLLNPWQYPVIGAAVLAVGVGGYFVYTSTHAQV